VSRGWWKNFHCLWSLKSNNKMRYKTIAIIQARMKSSRLPDKVMLDIAGKPMLQRVVERTARAKLVDQVIVATTSDIDEDPIARFCEQMNIACFRGSLQDVLDRYYQCAIQYSPDIVVRITADCPVIDPVLIDETIGVMTGKLLGNGLWKPQGNSEVYPSPTVPWIPWDYAATRLPPPWKRTYPIGLDAEAVTFKALKRAWKEAEAQHEREHVLPYLYDAENRFRCIIGSYKTDYGQYRWTVDTIPDLELIRQIYQRLGREDFTWQDILDLMLNNPELNNLNADIPHKTYLDVDERK
jgi:spore coat polysaccharide biosynthesis protein SpsF